MVEDMWPSTVKYENPKPEMVPCERCGALRSEDAMTENKTKYYCEGCFSAARVENAYDLCYVCGKPIDTVDEAQIGHGQTGHPVMVHEGRCHSIIEGDSTE